MATALVTGCLDKAGSTSPSGSSQASGAESSRPLYRSHFVGMTALATGTNASKLLEVWGLTASQDLRKQALDKIAKTPFQLWQKSLPSGAVDRPELIRPLLDDLLTAESYVELNGKSANYDSVLAVQLDQAHASVWETNLWQLLASWKFAKPQTLGGGKTGWETRGNGITFQLQRREKWLLAGWSLGRFPKSIR